MSPAASEAAVKLTWVNETELLLLEVRWSDAAIPDAGYLGDLIARVSRRFGALVAESPLVKGDVGVRVDVIDDTTRLVAEFKGLTEATVFRLSV